MAELLPDAKLIVVLRNPIDRAYSHYWWMRPLTERLSFEDAVRSELSGHDTEGRVYIGGGHYLERLQKVCEHYPRSALHVVIAEELRSSPAPTFAAVCRFLGVDDTVEPSNLGATINPAYVLRWPSLRPLMFKTRAFRWLPFDLGARIDRANRKQFKYPPMDPALRAELERYYEPYNTALAAWLGRDLDAWSARAGFVPQGGSS
jgi:hypothetical protein